MKKIISLCSVILSLVILITMFTACGDNKEDTNATTGEIANETGFSVVIEKNKATIKKDGEEYQELDFPKNSDVKFNKKYAKQNNEFIDMNFDGKEDFYIAINSVDGNISYYCWLFNDTTKEFDYSVILSELKNISVDAENQKILSSVEVDGEEHILSYTWVDGQLTLDSDYSEDNGGIPENVTQSATDNAIGVPKPNKPSKTESTTKKNNSSDNDKATKPDGKPSSSDDTTKKNDSSSDSDKTTKPNNKPSNTTTTSPNGGGVVLETGSLNDGGWY